MTSCSIAYQYMYGRNTVNCQSLVVGPNQITNFSNFCNGMTDLQYVDIDTSNGTSFAYGLCS